MFVGLGFDAHRFEPGRPLIVAGCTVRYDRGLAGFSDGDVAAHAIIDAILGAAALGDCGTMFPAGDPRFAGADSIDLLRRAVAFVADAGYSVVNLDCTIVAEQPALSPFIEQMRATVASAARIAVGRCSVKPKRTEGLGFTGQGQGMASFAVATLTLAATQVRAPDPR